MNDWAKMMMEDDAPSPDGLGQDYWMAPQLPYAVRQRIEIVFEVLSHLPLEQPVAVVSDAGKTIALNASLLELVGGASSDLLGRHWSGVMPGWPDRARGFRREGEQVFEEHLGRPDGPQVWVRVSLGPIADRGEPRAMAYLLFISKPDVETIDHDEVRRLRKSLQLLADMQTDFVVEIDRDGVMTFVSPSFCRAVGAAEKELVGREFTSRVRADDRAAAAASLDEALKPPFSGEMRARLAAEPDKALCVADRRRHRRRHRGPGPGGARGGRRPAGGSGGAASGVACGRRRAPPLRRIRAWRRSASSSRRSCPATRPGLMALAKAVAGAAGAECVLYNVMRGDVVETAVGWRLPPS